MNKSQNDMNFRSGAAESPGQRAPPKGTPGNKARGDRFLGEWILHRHCLFYVFFLHVLTQFSKRPQVQRAPGKRPGSESLPAQEAPSEITSLKSLRMKTRVIFDIFRYVIWTIMCVRCMHFCFQAKASQSKGSL